MVPTIKSIQRKLNVSYARARAARGIMDGTFSTMRFPSVIRWTAKCWHMPSVSERKMCALNEVLEGHGVEAIYRKEELFAEYVNQGDTYYPTIVRFRTGTYRIASWGDIVESNRL